MKCPREWTLVALLAVAAGCAQGTVDGLEEDAAITGGDSSTADDSAATDTASTRPPEDSGIVEPDIPAPVEDTGTLAIDVPPPPVDVEVPLPDVVTSIDTGFAVDTRPAVDVGSVLDVVTSVDVARTDAPRTDAPRTDAGPTCASPLVSCSGRCVDTSTDTANCGACGTSCAGATPRCASSRCAAAGCASGTSDCDGNTANGCEVAHRTTAACATATNLGSWCADVGCGFLCPGTSSRVVATRTGRASAWFRGRSNECSSCPARLEVIFTLTVPAGIDYDLFVYSDCGTTVLGRSQLLAGQTDRVTLSRSGDLGSDSFNWWVEVRYFSGGSCSPWTLTVQTRSGSATSC